MILETVCQLLAEQLDVSVGEIAPECDVAADLGADSLDQVEFLMALEEEFDLTITEEQACQLHTVADIAQFVSGELS